jgi:hypothetical protein
LKQSSYKIQNEASNIFSFEAFKDLTKLIAKARKIKVSQTD